MTRPLKVLFTMASLELGGAQRLMVTLLRHLDRTQVAPLLALSKRQGALIDDVPIDVPIFDLGRRSRADFPLLVARLGRIIRRERPDVVLSVMMHGNLVALGAARLSGTGVPVVISEHIAHVNYDYQSPLERRLGRILYPLANHAIGVSDGVSRELVDEWGISSSSVTTIHNPVDVSWVRELAKSKTPRRPSTGPLIVTAGRLSRQKGFEYLIQAFGAIRGRTGAHLVIVGDGEERARLQQTATDAGVADHITWVGADPNPYRWMAQADLFVLSSIFEGFAIVAVEAMALGIPVIATDCPHGPADVLQQGRCGVLVRPRDVTGLAHAMRDLLHDEDRRRELAELGRVRAMDFDAPRMAGAYVEVLAAVARAPLAKERLAA